MRRHVFLILVLLFVIALSGCQAIKFNNRSAPSDALDNAVQSKPKAHETALAADLFAAAKQKYVQAQDQISAGDHAKAKLLLDEALVFCIQDFNPDKDPEATRKLDGLFLEICVFQVRLGHLRGAFIRPTQDQMPLDLQYNPEVERWLSFFLTNGRRSMETYLFRSGKYIPLIEQILEENDLPLELKYLPIIESGYSPYAYSPASAVGLWQFIPATGKRYGLKIDKWVDERRDPVKATRAAAGYLGDLHQMFGSWSLAMASYNCGEGAVARSIERNNTRDYWQLDLPTETCNYVPKFYAAMLIAMEPELYGFYVTYEDPLSYESYELEKPADLKTVASLTGVSYEELKALNPELLSQYTHPKVDGYALKVPRDTFASFKAAFEAATHAQKYLSKDQLAKIKAPSGVGKVVYYRVKKGDTLSTIAKRYKTTVNNIKKWNKNARGKYLRLGMKLKIYPGKK